MQCVGGLDGGARDSGVSEVGARDVQLNDTGANDAGALRTPRAFVTQRVRNGQFSATALYAASYGDTFCQTAADTAHLGGQWFALLRDNSSRPVVVDDIYYSLQGEQLFHFDTASSLLVAETMMPWRITYESGVLLSSVYDPRLDVVNVWTGFKNPADPTMSRDACNDWISRSALWTGAAGDILSASRYLYNGVLPCSSTAALLCLERTP